MSRWAVNSVARFASVGRKRLRKSSLRALPRALEERTPEERRLFTDALLGLACFAREGMAGTAKASGEESPFHILKSSCGVKKSAIHGRGLFARRDIEKGSPITLYGVHAVGLCLNDTVGGRATSCLPEYQGYFEDNRDCTLNDPRRRFFIDACSDSPLDAHFKGHYANDANLCASASREDVDRYWRKSIESANCLIAPFGTMPFLAHVALRKIRAGEEILTRYGAQYWLPDTSDVPAPSYDQVQACTEQEAWAEECMAKGGKHTELPEMLEYFAGVHRERVLEELADDPELQQTMSRVFELDILGPHAFG